MNIDSKPKWQLSELFAALGLPPLANDAPVSGVSIDTRTLKPGDIYIPMVGERDGHAFVENAFSKGAVAAIVSTTFDASSVNGLCIAVPDTLIALQKLGVYNRSLTQAKIIAVTGSVGKTTTKEMLGHILKNFGKTVISKASYNNCWGVPLSLLDLTLDTEFGVFEVGMNNPGEIEPLADMITPDIAIITKIVEAHIGHMGSIEAIAVEKSTILSALKANGYALIHGGTASDQLLKDHAKNHNHMLFDMESIKANVINGTTHIDTKIGDTAVLYTLPFSGIHHVGNSVLSLETCHRLGLDVAKAAKAMETFTLPAGRGVTHALTLSNNISITLIDDAYNSNPASMRAGLLSLKALKKAGRRIAVLGEMRELGTESATYHRDLLDSIIETEIDLVFCCGESMRHLYDVLPESIRGAYANTSDELIPYATAALKTNDIVFVKGSKGSKVSHVVNYLINNNVMSHAQ
ncbi:MAG: UDP-N-acetylmuramoyl-tripeptide--D-alanyl-D-alanine ligase [Alphaproteobacteria bacterium]|nr:UDP-N-acetylmuramoyl-tripeptide--D-alanyl-D-alanine ligase [Alphaproteobacteria bacterium]MDP5012763.1 UDP-N-acetylmuramoyl-tripeptide--D-alanyl-D-alanine ligase [Alphaproteobacteria bacterium]